MPHDSMKLGALSSMLNTISSRLPPVEDVVVGGGSTKKLSRRPSHESLASCGNTGSCTDLKKLGSQNNLMDMDPNAPHKHALDEGKTQPGAPGTEPASNPRDRLLSEDELIATITPETAQNLFVKKLVGGNGVKGGGSPITPSHGENPNPPTAPALQQQQYDQPHHQHPVVASGVVYNPGVGAVVGGKVNDTYAHANAPARGRMKTDSLDALDYVLGEDMTDDPNEIPSLAPPPLPHSDREFEASLLVYQQEQLRLMQQQMATHQRDEYLSDYNTYKTNSSSFSGSSSAAETNSSFIPNQQPLLNPSSSNPNLMSVPESNSLNFFEDDLTQTLEDGEWEDFF